MRISEISSILQEIEVPRITPIQIQGSTSFKNLAAFREAVLEVSRVPELEHLTTELLSSTVFQTYHDQFDPDEAFRKNWAGFIHTLRALKGVFSRITPSGDEASIVVKLPTSQDFKTIISDQDQILKALEAVLLHPTINGQLVLKSWETGSFWLHLYLGSALAVVVVGSIAWSACVVRNKWLQGEMLVKQLEALGVKNELTAHAAEKAKEALDAAIDAEALAIYDRYAKGETDHEQVARIKRSITMLAKLVGRGAEVHPSLMVPEDAKNLFPDFKVLETIASRIPQLKDKAAEENITVADEAEE